MLITRSSDNIVRQTSVMDPALSDHYAGRCKVLLAKPPFERKEIAYRSLKRIDFARFREDIKNSKLMDDDDLSLNDYKRMEQQNPFPDTCLRQSDVLLRQFTPVTGVQLAKLIGKSVRKSCWGSHSSNSTERVSH